MNTPLEQTKNTPDNQAPLTPLADFRKSGRAPVEMHHLKFTTKNHWWNMEQSVNLAGSGLLVKATFSNGCVNREQMRGDQNAQTSVMLLNHN